MINPEIVVAEDEHRAPGAGLNLRTLGRIVAYSRPFRGMLVCGLIATVFFALLHTLSIGGVFPIFKILLEEEGLEGWVYRSVAGKRLGVSFAQPDSAESDFVRVVGVREKSDARERGLRAFDLMRDTAGGSAADLLERLATVEAGTAISVIARSIDVEGEVLDRAIDLYPQELSKFDYQWWLSRVAPLAGGDTARDKLRVLVRILGGLVVLVFVANVFRFAGEVLIAKAVLRSLMLLRARLYERALQLPMSFYSGQETSDIVTRFVQDIQEIQRGLMTLFGRFIREPLRAAFLLGAAFLLDWRITLVMVMVAPLAVMVFFAVGRKVKNANRELLRGYGRMIGALTTSLQNIRVVKAYTAESREREYLGKVDWGMFSQQLRLAKLQAFVSPALETVAVVAGSLMTVWLAGLVLDNELSPSKFLLLGALLSILTDPLRKLSDVYVRILRSTAGADRIFEVIDSPIESARPGSSVELQPLTKRLEYQNVSFTYPGAETPAVKEVSISIEKGETVAIVGPNGCGKTTLVSLLPRFFDPGEGRVLYDGVDLRDAKIENLREQISLVTQEAIVFAATPIENIAYSGRPVDAQRAKDAARRAHADDFIEKLPQSWDTVLGERGTTLSGGQRQRLAIARAIYRDAPILIFDEATSQIDTESEQKIQNALKEFSTGRTTLIIAHRLSTIQFADRIIVMDAGRVIDSGVHTELFKRCSLYRNLCETQFLNGEPANVT